MSQLSYCCDFSYNTPEGANALLARAKQSDWKLSLCTGKVETATDKQLLLEFSETKYVANDIGQRASPEFVQVFGPLLKVTSLYSPHLREWYMQDTQRALDHVEKHKNGFAFRDLFTHGELVRKLGMSRALELSLVSDKRSKELDDYFCDASRPNMSAAYLTVPSVFASFLEHGMKSATPNERQFVDKLIKRCKLTPQQARALLPHMLSPSVNDELILMCGSRFWYDYPVDSMWLLAKLSRCGVDLSKIKNADAVARAAYRGVRKNSYECNLLCRMSLSDECLLELIKDGMCVSLSDKAIRRLAAKATPEQLKLLTRFRKPTAASLGLIQDLDQDLVCCVRQLDEGKCPDAVSSEVLSYALETCPLELVQQLVKRSLNAYQTSRAMLNADPRVHEFAASVFSGDVERVMSHLIEMNLVDNCALVARALELLPEMSLADRRKCAEMAAKELQHPVMGLFNAFLNTFE